MSKVQRSKSTKKRRLAECGRWTFLSPSVTCIKSSVKQLQQTPFFKVALQENNTNFLFSLDIILTKQTYETSAEPSILHNLITTDLLLALSAFLHRRCHPLANKPHQQFLRKSQQK